MAYFSEDQPASGSAWPPSGATVTDTRQQRAHIMSIESSGMEATALVRTEQGQQVMVPLSLLVQQPDRSYHLPFAFDKLQHDSGSGQPTVIKVLQEELEIGKRVVDTGKGVRVHKTVTEHEQLVDLPLFHDEVLVQHVPIGKFLALADIPLTRYDGDTLVVPVIEEVLVVEKHMRLKEEVRITKRQREEHMPQTVVLKSEQVTIERFDEQRDASGRNTSGGQLPAS